MEIYKYLPLASDRMGMLWTLSSIEGVCILEFGPAGTTHYAIEGVGSLNANDKAKVYSTHMDEKDIAFGHHHKLEKAILEIDQNIEPKYLIIMASSISSIIGTDIEGICSMMQEEVKAKLIPVQLAGFKGDYTRGIEQALYLISKEMIHPSETKNETYNLLGCNIDQYQFESDSIEIKRMMKNFFNKEVQTTFTAYTSIAEIEGATKASLNIVLRKEALKAAKYMEQTYGIPYIYQKPYGLEGTKHFVESISNTTGWTMNEADYQKEVAKVKKHLWAIKRRFYGYEGTKACAIFADRDTAIGMNNLLVELGLEVDHMQIIHEANEEGIASGYSELDRMKCLRDKKLLMLLADGVTLNMPHEAKFDMQISNPNLESIIVYPYTPYVGLRGVMWMIQQLLNVH